MMPLISADRIGLAYPTGLGLMRKNDFYALRNVSFNVFRGETLGVVGRNGCGKSSLLRILGGIIEPSEGKIQCDQGVVRALLSLGSGFNYHLSGRDNALLSMMLQGRSKEEALNLIPHVQEFSELGDFFDKPVVHYSAGMRTRLGFSTALMEEVDVLLIDEVMSVGDPHFRIKAEKAIKDKLKGDKTVILISHNMDNIRELCDRVLWLDQGRLVKIGTTRAVLDSYKLFIDSVTNTTQNYP